MRKKQTTKTMTTEGKEVTQKRANPSIRSQKPRFVSETFVSEVSPDEAYEFTQRARAAALEREPGEPRPFRFTGNEDVLCPPERERVAQELAKAGEGSEQTFREHVLEQAIRTQAQTSWLPGQPLKNVEVAIAAMTGIAPQDEQEMMLVSQMFASHNIGMEYARRSISSTGSPEQSIMYANAGAKMMNVHRRLSEVLDRRRGIGQPQIKVGQQVNVQAVGQAIFGNVEAPDAQSKAPAPCAAPAALTDCSGEGMALVDVTPRKKKVRARRSD